MRVWGIRAAILFATIAMNMAEGALLHPLAQQAGTTFQATLIDDCILGLAMGLVICLVHGIFRRQYERKLQSAVDELNHHVRNSMQVILNQQVLCPHCNSETVSGAIRRVDWALREILPPEMQPDREPETSSTSAS